MPINFFAANCQTTTNNQLFGLCDTPPPPNNPAYIDLDSINKPGWIAEVDNINSIAVTFTAIDNCIVIKRPDGTPESRCDGMLTYNNTVIFIELKNRMSDGWLGKARDQLITTINIFIANHNIGIYTDKRAHVANYQRPFFSRSFIGVINDIKKQTGFNTEVNTKIEIK